jgi:hypothetical protein
MIYKHRNLADGKWKKMPFFEQMANIGSEVSRTISWKGKNKEYSNKAFDRTLELLDMTIDDSKNKGRLKELIRLREVLADYFVFDNDYKSNDDLWQKYFYSFNYAARLSC